MKFEVQLTEVVSFLKSCYNVNVGLKNVEKGKIEVKYFISADITIQDLNEDVVTIYYKTSGMVDLLVKGVNLFWGKKFDKMPFELNPKTRVVVVNLKEIEAFKNFLKYHYVSDILFIEDSIVVLLNTRITNDNT